ncbi:acyltransferase [soil metagenome]
MQRLDGLQALRGFAAAYVVLFHLVPIMELGASLAWLKTFASGGMAGVHLFFVLSGFVMWHTTHDKAGTAAAGRFVLKRFARIYLSYWPWLLITSFLFLLMAPQVLAGRHFFNETTLFPGGRPFLISVAWTLTYELYFYALFAGLVLVGRHARLLLLGLGLAGVLVFNVAIQPKAFAYDFGGFFLSPLIAEFLAGSLLAAAFRAGAFGLASWLSAVGGVAIIGVGIWIGITAGVISSPPLQQVASLGLASCGIVMVVVALEHRISWPRWTVLLGDQSYSLYLGHPVLLSVATLSGWFAFAHGRDILILIAGGALLLLMLAITLLYYRALELPLYRWACDLIDTCSGGERARHIQNGS